MLRNLKDLENYAIRATDGDIGHVKDFYFDDEAWAVRYLIVETGGWLSSRKVLISPIALGTPDWANQVLPVAITKEQVSNSPDIDTDRSVSRQHEMRNLAYYGYPSYWGGAGLWGSGAYPGMMVLSGDGGVPAGPYIVDPKVQENLARADEARHRNDDHHLHSCNAVIGYHIHASDGDIGHVQGLLVDEQTWAVRYMIVSTNNWWIGHEVLIAPQWIGNVSWDEGAVTVGVNRQSVQNAPPYDSSIQLNRTQEIGIQEHYARPGYWASAVPP